MSNNKGKRTETSLTVKHENTTPLSMTVAMTTPETSLSALPVDYEPIRARLADMVEMLLAAMAAQPMSIQLKLMMNGASQLLRMGIQNEDARKLHLLLTCLGGIVGAVSDLDSCQPDYEAKVEPYIEQLAALLAGG